MDANPIRVIVPPARIPEEPGAVIPHAGICDGGVGQPTSLSESAIKILSLIALGLIAVAAAMRWGENQGATVFMFFMGIGI